MSKTVPKDKTKISRFPLLDQDKLYIDAKKEPQIFEFQEGNRSCNEVFNVQYFLWRTLHYLTANKQNYPTLSGRLVILRKLEAISDLKKTVVTYLAPINASVNAFSTVFQFLTYIQSLCQEANMPYVNVTLDSEATMNAYKLIWNYSEKFANVVIHLGDFHFMKESFNILGMLVQGSGFEDILFQSGVFSSDSLNSVISGAHYNRCWRIHQHLTEALERLLFHRFTYKNGDEMPQAFADEDISNVIMGQIDSLISDSAVRHLWNEYECFKSEVRNGELGKTAQFCLINYLDVMESIHLLHTAVQGNNYELRVEGWRMMPFFFALNKTNYARYGGLLHATATEFRYNSSWLQRISEAQQYSVQGQDKYPLHTAIDQRGEQTLKKDAKSTGGIKSFASSSESVSTWTLNRASQVSVTAKLKSFQTLLSRIRSTSHYVHIR